jgi:hypothetical protein
VGRLIVAVADPVAQGFVASLAQPGGMITGFGLEEPAKILKQERADPTVEHEGQHAAHRRFWRVWDMPSLTSRKDFNFVIGEHTIAVFWKPLAFFGQPKRCCDLPVRRPKAKSC